MSSLSSLVAADGPLHLGVTDGPDVRALQIALSQAGYRVDINVGTFTADTDYWLRQFQKQHGFIVNGVLDQEEAELLDSPHVELVAKALPLVNVATGWPHDDTASMLAFYGRPWEDASLMVPVLVPFAMTYRLDSGELLPIHTIKFHKKAAAALGQALTDIAFAAASDPSVLKRIGKFSGSFNYRPIRGSSRLSCHAFAAAGDWDAEDMPLGKTGITPSDMPQPVVDAFDRVKFTWGNTYIGRKDPMHFQAAHE